MLDYMVMEAVAMKAAHEEREAQKKYEEEQARKKFKADRSWQESK